ncbi:uncharacterized protein IUM83_17564 [Phytophthora cinnamomi]|uniref:uncharacterized protein n=1 Tax=Phytophthora cinnamomi TaxID=4785 RepID=UPI00355AB759|nr:hypothetical protein IUM83_17564 [Phytophthora cinnamomi]
MSFILRFVALLLALTHPADACASKQLKPGPSSLGRNLKREENVSDPNTTDFLAESASGQVENDHGDDWISIAASIEALVTTEAANEDSPFYSNWSTTIHHRDNTTDETNSDQESEFENVGVGSALSSELSTSGASALSDQAFGSAFGSGSAIENSVNDVNMAGGEAVPSSLASTKLSSGMAAWIIACALALDAAN